jgi:biotin carboxyl carrier protein
MARVVRTGRGAYLVADTAGGEPRQHLVFVAGPRGATWAFSEGRVFRPGEAEPAQPRSRTAGAVQALTSPMPATVVKVLATPGQAVKTGDTLVIVEAMKMELPVRAPADAVVKAVHCREKEIVQPDQVLVELE